MAGLLLSTLLETPAALGTYSAAIRLHWPLATRAAHLSLSRGGACRGSRRVHQFETLDQRVFHQVAFHVSHALGSAGFLRSAVAPTSPPKLPRLASMLPAALCCRGGSKRCVLSVKEGCTAKQALSTASLRAPCSKVLLPPLRHMNCFDKPVRKVDAKVFPSHLTG